MTVEDHKEAKQNFIGILEGLGVIWNSNFEFVNYKIYL